jgi:Ca-activated chloride channel homolog
LADKGNGNYAYIDNLAEARKVLVAQAAGTLSTLAQDVKIQIEFNPTHVGAYRLIGYENRRLAARDFNDDSKDAGELGAGHSVTALYEIVPAGAVLSGVQADALKYRATEPSPQYEGELGTLKLRYKTPGTASLPTAPSHLISHVLRDGQRALEQTTSNFRFSAAVATFGMVLRGSAARGNASLSLARNLAANALGVDPHGYRHEFLNLVDTAARLDRSPTPAKGGAIEQVHSLLDY